VGWGAFKRLLGGASDCGTLWNQLAAGDPVYLAINPNSGALFVGVGSSGNLGMEPEHGREKSWSRPGGGVLQTRGW
jgi:hypothetical protein